jgi:hypothetical protein
MADPTKENNFKVRLIPLSSLTYGGDPTSIRESQVAFDVTPTFSETRSAEYAPVTPVHMPGAMQIYKHTNSRQFEIGAHLISRNVADALTNMANLQKLRAWLMPYFGGTNTLNSQQEDNRSSRARAGQNLGPQTNEERDASLRDRVITEGVQLRGAPPDILYLYAYSTGASDLRGGGPIVNLNRIPVVMTNLSITYPEDVDYIPVYSSPFGTSLPGSRTEPFPRKMDVAISLVETHSPREYERFDLMAYKLGNLTNF